MADPTINWTESDWPAFVIKHQEFAHVKVESIPLIASQLRHGIPCRLVAQFTSGSAHVVFEIAFDDGCRWICRIRHRDSKEHPRYIKMTMDSTVTGMRYVQENTSIPVPTVHGYQADYTATDIGACYMFMDAIPGRQRDQFGENITESELSTLFREIADSAVQLASVDFPKIGRLYADGGHYEIGPFVNEDGTTYGPFVESVEYYQYLATKRRGDAERKGDRVGGKRCQLPYRWLRLSLIMRSFGLVHGDYGA